MKLIPLLNKADVRIKGNKACEASGTAPGIESTEHMAPLIATV